jgi:hypothetical protein
MVGRDADENISVKIWGGRLHLHRKSCKKTCGIDDTRQQYQTELSTRNMSSLSRGAVILGLGSCTRRLR